MRNSIFYYKELTPAEVGNTGTHEIYVRMPNNFEYEDFFKQVGVENGSVTEVNFSALDITNGAANAELEELRFVYFSNSNKEKRLPGLRSLFEKHNVKEGDIFFIESRTENGKTTFIIKFYRKGSMVLQPSQVYFSKSYEDGDHKILATVQSDNTPRQVIYYGAPGTGKSHTINEQTSEAAAKGNVFRTTFHPDSDYSTFVGSYKPTMEPKEPIYTSAELISKLAEIKNLGGSYPCQKFGTKYWESLKDLSANEIKNIINACGFTDSMGVEVSKGIAIGEEYGNKLNQKQIVYRFVAQAFTNAYVRAWQTEEPVFLVIEEINRGNCAQIFGDLFQLLDRDDAGKSKYPIIPDTDLGNFIREKLISNENIPDNIRNAEEMALPSNLFIWASMNTSDQSLFPIDSAFKRRWDWKYVPIENAHKNYVIVVNNTEYVWWEFLKAINKEVFELTNSEDKQLGYFFVKRLDGIIDAATLVNKVYFYLWNDVFKDYDLDGQKAFKNKETQKAISFKDFFIGGLNEELAEQVLLNLELQGRKLDE